VTFGITGDYRGVNVCRLEQMARAIEQGIQELAPSAPGGRRPSRITRPPNRSGA
jgi:hypothetical protein